MLSVIIPAYNEEKMVAAACERLNTILSRNKIENELIFIDDGSRDETWNIICQLSNVCPNVVGIHFSRNFGKEAAMFAGLEKAKGDCAVVIDCDLQHPPEKIVEMYQLWQAGYEVVEGIKSSRGNESSSHRFAAKTFYKLISKATGLDMTDASDFKLLDRKVIDTLNQMPERKMFFRALSFWVGFKKTTVTYNVQERTQGESKWSTKQLIKYAFTNLSSFSSAPLHIITVLGIAVLIIAIVFSLITLIQKICGSAVEGFTTVIILLLFGFSAVMISLGIIAYYVGLIYEEIKGRPRYIISETCGDK